MIRIPDVSHYSPSPPCSCDTCKSMCERPCWPTPDEAAALLDAGFAHKLMLDWWVGGFNDEADDRDYDVYIVCGANPGREGKRAAEWWTGLTGGCSMLTPEGLCSLHDRGLKPFEGRVAHHSYDTHGAHEAVAREWDSPRGREIVARFRAAVGLDT